MLKSQKPFGGKEDEILKINSTLQSIGNIITVDYANRINERKIENKLLKRAKKADIPVEVINHKEFTSREELDEAMIKRLYKYKPKLVVLICLQVSAGV